MLHDFIVRLRTLRACTSITPTFTKLHAPSPTITADQSFPLRLALDVRLSTQFPLSIYHFRCRCMLERHLTIIVLCTYRPHPCNHRRNYAKVLHRLQASRELRRQPFLDLESRTDDSITIVNFSHLHIRILRLSQLSRSGFSGESKNPPRASIVSCCQSCLTNWCSGRSAPQVHQAFSPGN